MGSKIQSAEMAWRRRIRREEYDAQKFIDAGSYQFPFLTRGTLGIPVIRGNTKNEIYRWMIRTGSAGVGTVGTVVPKTTQSEGITASYPTTPPWSASGKKSDMVCSETDSQILRKMEILETALKQQKATIVELESSILSLVDDTKGKKGEENNNVDNSNRKVKI